ncbi:NUDIX hydrolase [Haloarcula laminariae]|uniref:NUDIX hydrolase n=1 Tax=Haloarcula laminariae TaxID=2961577 RepID=UPI0021CAB28E|nr:MULTISPECIES: NUDIX domain-containing protein [Halomicroarcula]
MSEPFLEATISIRGVIRRPDGAVLLVREADTGNWELPGGRIRPDEEVRNCLRREIREETGLSVRVHLPVKTYSWQNGSGEGRFAVYYRCTADDDGVTLSSEHTEATWADDETASARLSEPQWAAVELSESPRNGDCNGGH